MQLINFNHNWNKKLDCDCFTTLRLSKKYEVGEYVEIKFKNETKFIGKIIGKKRFKLHNINEYIARLDTGYSAKECQDTLKNMYKNKNVDWLEQNIYFYLIQRT